MVNPNHALPKKKDRNYRISICNISQQKFFPESAHGKRLTNYKQTDIM